MIKLFFLLVFFIPLIGSLSVLSANAQQKATQEIHFSKKPYAEVIAAARATHKKVFVDAFATWCVPCKELRKRTFTDPKAANYFNKHFINISVDVEKGGGVDRQCSKSQLSLKN